MNKLSILALLFSLCFYSLPSIAFAQVVARTKSFRSVLPRFTVAKLPPSPAIGKVVIVTDGVNTSDCNVGGNPGTFALCFYDTVQTEWLPLGSGGGALGLDANFDIVARIDGAISQITSFRVGAGVGKEWCFYHDGVNLVKDSCGTSIDSVTSVMDGQVEVLYDEEAAQDARICDLDSIALGSGTCTYQTGYQVVASNLGVAFTASDDNAACASGKYNIYGDLSDTAFKYCENNTSYFLNSAIVVYKDTDETLTTNDAVCDDLDDEITHTQPASETWVYEYHIRYKSTSDIPDFKMCMTVPSGATGTISVIGLDPASTSGVNTNVSIGTVPLSSSASMGADDGLNSYAIYSVEVTTTGGGAVTPTWSQVTSNGTAVIVMAGSYGIARRRTP